MRRPIVIVGAVVALGVAAWLAFGYFGVQTLFTEDKVDEAAPSFARSGDSASADDPDAAAAADAAADAVTFQGSFIERSHATDGTALVLTDEGGRRVLRFEGFETDNGPDLNVYLSPAGADAAASEFDDDYVDLGDLKGNQGDQNYEIPDDVDLDKYSTVVIWCVRFSVAFGAADLQAA
ncbi:MAG: DM13 domain-containing protein [Actinobacteria bacterium]|nr:DM13 domain-containing protein [Actinomycetota bacterium]